VLGDGALAAGRCSAVRSGDKVAKGAHGLAAAKIYTNKGSVTSTNSKSLSKGEGGRALFSSASK
jgi:hypothetical protein